MKTSSVQLLLIRLAIGGLFLNLGLEKYHEGWLTTSEPLAESLQRYLQHAIGFQATYLHYVATPYVGLWAKLIIIGEFAVGVSFLLGLLVRVSSIVAIIMVINFHAANGNLFSWNFFGSPWAAVLLAGLIAIFLAHAGRWAGIDALLSKLNSKSVFW